MKKATYFRFMYQNRKQSIVHTAHVTRAGEKENYLMVYLCRQETDEMDRPDEGTDERFTMSGEDIDLLILDGIGKEACDGICRLLEENRVKEVILPAKDEAAQWLKLGMADKITVMQEGENFRFEKAGWETWVGCYGDEEGSSLAVYHGPVAVNPQEKDCLLSVKPFGKELPCSSCIHDENHVCAMRCSLYNDFELCKKHNERRSGKYVTGTLLLGNVKLQKYGVQLFRELEANENAAGKIRFIALSAGGNQEYWSPEVIHAADPEEEQYNRYFIVSEGAENNAEVWKDVMASSMRHKLLMTTDHYGICAGGFFADREG